MRSAVLCHASADGAFAGELGAFLESNCPLAVYTEEGLIRSPGDLVDTVERALSADTVLVLLSPDSIPENWSRDRWEPVFIDQPRELGTQLAFVHLKPCKFPELLRRKAFFDLSRDPIAGQRLLKRWLLMQDRPFHNTIDLPERSPTQELTPEFLDELQGRLTDHPGSTSALDAEQSLSFAHACKEDFEGAFWIDCAHRSPVGILGDTAAALGLRLPGTVDQNWRAVRRFLAERRCLIIFDHIASEDTDLFVVEGKTSLVFVSSSPPPARRSLEETAELFASSTRRERECLNALGDAQYYLHVPQSEGAVELGILVVAFLRHRDRLAEAYEILEALSDGVREQDNSDALRHFTWEKSWILERWGHSEASREEIPAPAEPKQLTLAFLS